MQSLLVRLLVSFALSHIFNQHQGKLAIGTLHVLFTEWGGAKALIWFNTHFMNDKDLHQPNWKS